MKELFFIALLFVAFQANAQKYMTKTASAEFTSKAPMETIDGKNKAVACLLDSKTGKLDFVIQIKSFVFEKQLLQEHFNENYMESSKYPKSTFSGSITNLSAINFAKEGEYRAEVSGKLTIHGVTKEVKEVGKLIVKGNQIVLNSSFPVLVADYKIEIPGAVKDKIAKEVKVVVNASLEKMK
jgi:polyisoprenoid-binding protein YceI